MRIARFRLRRDRASSPGWPVPILIAAAITLPACQTHRPTLVGFASLPADTFADGPTSGQFITPANGIAPPFVNQQPVQGFSSVARAPEGDFFVMPDNGFGNKPTSPDFVLRVYRISVAPEPSHPVEVPPSTTLTLSPASGKSRAAQAMAP